MIQYKSGTCTECGDEDVLIVKKIPPNKYCHPCNEKRKAARKPKKEINWAKPRQKPLKRSALNYKRKSTGEGVLFESIWNSRPRKSFLTGEPLGDDAYAWYFAHVLRKAKGHYPGFKLYDKNIILLTKEQHDLWDGYFRKPKILLAKDPRWQKVFDLYEELQHEYYA